MCASAVRDTLLDRTLALSPDQFEVLCKVVLTDTLDTTSLNVTPSSQDGGIDIEGRLEYDWFAADYGVQVKRYATENTVSSDRIHRLAGALVDNDYHLGTFITTSSYTGPAVDVAERLPVKLVDGQQFADAMCRREIGVTQTDGDYELDETFWETLSKTDEKVPASEVPLGSNFERVRAVLLAMRATTGTKTALRNWVSDELDIDLLDRHVYINANSATVLGLARKEPGGKNQEAQRWGLSPTGAEYLRSTPRSPEAQRLLADAIRGVTLIELLLDELRDAGALTIDDIDDVIARETDGLSESSVTRRSSSVRKWLSVLPEITVETTRPSKTYQYDPDSDDQSQLP